MNLPVFRSTVDLDTDMAVPIDDRTGPFPASGYSVDLATSEESNFYRKDLSLGWHC